MNKLLLVTVISIALSACAANGSKTNADKDVVVDAVVEPVVMNYATITNENAGSYMDIQQQEFSSVLLAEQAAQNIELQRMEDNSLKIDVSSEMSFDFASVTLKTTFIPTLTNISNILVRYPNTIIHVIGHTDSIGTESNNMHLSQERAASVVNYLVSQDIPAERLVTVGRGELEPRAGNDTEAGRQLNRRVEIYVKPIIQGQESEAYETPQASKS